MINLCGDVDTALPRSILPQSGIERVEVVGPQVLQFDMANSGVNPGGQLPVADDGGVLDPPGPPLFPAHNHYNSGMSGGCQR